MYSLVHIWMCTQIQVWPLWMIIVGPLCTPAQYRKSIIRYHHKKFMDTVIRSRSESWRSWGQVRLTVRNKRGRSCSFRALQTFIKSRSCRLREPHKTNFNDNSNYKSDHAFDAPLLPLAVGLSTRPLHRGGLQLLGNRDRPIVLSR